MKNYYYILGISKNASQEEIKNAFRKLSVKFHPDKNEGDSFMSDMFKNINEAYTILSNSDEKAKFDFELSEYENNANSNYINQDELYQLTKLTDDFIQKSKLAEEKKILYKKEGNYRNKPFKFVNILIPFLFVLFTYFVFPPNRTGSEQNQNNNNIYTWVTTDDTFVYEKPSLNSKTIGYLYPKYRLRSQNLSDEFIEIIFVDKNNFITKGYVFEGDLLKKEKNEALLMEIIHPKLILSDSTLSKKVKELIINEHKDFLVFENEHDYLIKSINNNYYYNYSIDEQTVNEYGFKTELKRNAVVKKLNTLGFYNENTNSNILKNKLAPCIEVELFKINNENSEIVYRFVCDN